MIPDPMDVTDTRHEQAGRCRFFTCENRAVAEVELPYADGFRRVPLCAFHHDWVLKMDHGSPS
ncbi:hypothetical protein GCM10028787_03650 [Brachybacterium horti]